MNFIKMILAFTAIFFTPGSLCVFLKPKRISVIPIVAEMALPKKSKTTEEIKCTYTFYLKRELGSTGKQFSGFSTSITNDEDEFDAVARVIASFQNIFAENIPYFALQLKDYIGRRSTTFTQADTVYFLLPMQVSENLQKVRKISESCMKHLLVSHKKGVNSPSSMCIDPKVLDVFGRFGYLFNVAS